ncbi:Mrr restriction system protein [Pannus brasiliensis CCIBt3594]|uniref:Mrr restriction system protein n=1 Tax=Pannus brasiliensis CCIBt3594 TaxID=1427578 RepID=A0AAW9R0K5_9CHRO
MAENLSSSSSYYHMHLPILKALKLLGGSGTTEEINEKVAQILNIPDEFLNTPHGNTSQTEIEYRLAWNRTDLKKRGFIENSSRGVWALTPKSTDIDIDSLDDYKELINLTQNISKNQAVNSNDIEENTALEIEETLEWEQQLHQEILRLSPSAFERLSQRLLRESGFTNVEVTGKSGDGGIDGVGIARIHGFLSFPVLFQCKRYQGSVTASQIRDFRGAMQGRTDKGLFITTGTFTRDAKKEATRDGVPPIDLIDGEELVQRLKELKLGVKIEMVESISIDTDWFANI